MSRNALQSHRRLLASVDEDPLSGVANLFDVAMVFAVVLLIALVSRLPTMGLLSADEEITGLRNPGTPEMEVIHRDAMKLQHYRVSHEQLTGQGTRLGIAYRLPNGEVVYVPGNQ